MAHREGIREFLRDVEVHGLVYDWGCGTKPIKNYLKPNEAQFYGIDKLDHVGANLVFDAEEKLVHWPALPNNIDGADYAFCLEVIEHVWNSEMFLKNIYINLKPGGTLYLSQPYMYQTHKEDDCRRFTHHGLKRAIEEAGFVVEELVPTVGELETAEGFILRAKKPRVKNE